MRIKHALVVLLVGFSGWHAVNAQSLFGLTPPRPGDLPVAPGKGLERPLGSGAYLYYASVRGLTYASAPVGRVTAYYYIAPASPYQAAGTAAGQQLTRNPGRVPPPRPADAEAPVVTDTIAPGTPASVFRPIRPEARGGSGIPTVFEPAGPAKPKIPSKFDRDNAPPLPPPLPGAPPIPAEPKTASDRQIESGREAFKAGQYSRAERCFRRAAESFPEDRQVYFLLAQARFALGKYAEAVAAIYVGMQLQPNWPNVPYRSRDLYGTKTGDLTDQLRRLAETSAKNGDDPFLAFLYAYQLWFDNRREEARLLFQRAKTLTSDPSFIDRFLQANPGSSVDDAIVELLTPGPRF
jgi:hypothetical protein